MDELNLHKMSRKSWGTILVLAAVFALAGAWLLEKLGLRSEHLRPLSFVGTVVSLKLALFTFWPQISRAFPHGADAASPLDEAAEELALAQLNQKAKRPSSVALWDQKDPRLDVSLFAGNVPTFVLNADQRFLDWNAAFALVFGRLAGIKRGAHVTNWFEHLDNFRRVPKRAEKLYGDGILPITDRERVTFLSKEWGRMVFTKIMTPIVDRGSGRIIGWTVVLNINSVNKRQEFFERLYADIAHETRRVRYAASLDGLYEGWDAQREFLDAHAAPLAMARRVLDLGAATGWMTLRLLRDGKKVTAVDSDVHLLRRLKDQTDGFEARMRLVKKDLDDTRGLPAARYDGATMVANAHRFDQLAATLADVQRSLKEGGVLTVSAIIHSEGSGGGIEALHNALRGHLEASERYDNLKHQFNHVLEFERDQALRHPLVSREELRAAVLEAGFMIEEEVSGLRGGSTLLLVARK